MTIQTLDPSYCVVQSARDSGFQTGPSLVTSLDMQPIPSIHIPGCQTARGRIRPRQKRSNFYDQLEFMGTQLVQSGQDADVQLAERSYKLTQVQPIQGLASLSERFNSIKHVDLKLKLKEAGNLKLNTRRDLQS